MALNQEKIAEILQRTPTAEAFANYAACRERNIREGVSKLPAIRAQMSKDGFQPVPQDLLSMFRELERAGVGELKNDMFKWSVSIKEVGRALNPAKNEVRPLPTAHKSLVIFFDKNKEATISFTPNLSVEEVKFLAEKILNECK